MNIYSYRKLSDKYTTYEALLPESEGETLGHELCTLDGVTYVSIPNEAQIPTQHEGITLTPVTLTPELYQEIKENSWLCDLIQQRIHQRVRAVYSQEDENYFNRISHGASMGLYDFEPGEQAELLAFGAHVEACRQWGRDERAKLGLIKPT